MLLLAIAWAARAPFIALMPARIHSDDVDHWIVVARALRHGLNPYATTTYLNWPPAWMVCVSLLDHVSRAFDVSFFLVLRLFLIATESVVIVVVYRFLHRVAPREAMPIVLVGLCLNPVAILLVCQHGNFDVLLGLWVTVGAFTLARQEGPTDILRWLAASLCFGIAALVKTVPLVLAPLLARTAALARPLERWIAAALFVGPIALGLSVILAYAPHAVVENVIRYRSSPGYFGITGLLAASGADGASSAYTKAIFPLALAVAEVVAFRWLWRRGLDGSATVLAAALALLAVPALGPGYAPQYAYWWLPLLVATYPLFDTEWRRILALFYALLVTTYVAEYALVPSQGAFLHALLPHSGRIGDISDSLRDPYWSTLLRLPLFLGTLLVLAGGFARIRERREQPVRMPQVASTSS